jgi:hypothetical protein
MRVCGDKRVVLTQDRYNQPEDGPHMEFRLVYEGELYSTQKDPVRGQPDKRREHKHEIRKKFHYQLERLWELTPFLKTGKSSGPGLSSYAQIKPPPLPNKDTLAARHALYGFNFIPLVTRDLHLLCGIDILFLRPDPLGEVLQSGDIDNRIKTLFDALRIPVAGEDYSKRTPEDDEKPFYCLLEEDKLITKISVETGQLLSRPNPKPDMTDVLLIVTVTLRPYELHFGNLPFGG